MPERVIPIGRSLPTATPRSSRPDWQQADPGLIAALSERAQARSGGGWCVVATSDELGSAPIKARGRDLVLWRVDDEVRAAPNACPHMGAELCTGRVEDQKLVCPWHGLRLGTRHGSWRTIPAHDDGVLIWARAIDEEHGKLVIPERPSTFVHGVIHSEARCDPEDVVANRLDPWHGVHYHPHSFARLDVLAIDDDVLTLRVAYRVAGPLCVEVDATFHSPTRRSIVMTIVGGDGVGSVVETHATPIEPGRCVVTEATLATSDRPGFRFARRFAPLVRRMIERRAARLWVEDVAYAERRYALRTKSATMQP